MKHKVEEFELPSLCGHNDLVTVACAVLSFHPNTETGCYRWLLYAQNKLFEYIHDTRCDKTFIKVISDNCVIPEEDARIDEFHASARESMKG